MNKTIVKMLFTILSLITIASGEVDLTKGEIKRAYELGAFHTVGQMNRNIKIQGWEEESIKFDNYMVTLEIEEQPTYRILSYLRYGYTEGVAPVITTSKKIVFASYEYEADAVFLRDLLNKFYFKNEKKQCVIYQNINNKEFRKAPFLYKDMYLLMKKELKQKLDAQVYVVDKNEELEKQYKELKNEYEVLSKKYKDESKNKVEKIKPKEPELQKEPKVHRNPLRYFKIKNGYSKIETLKSLEGFAGYDYKYDASKFISAGFYDEINNQYEFKKFVYTTTGDKFIKVYNKALYVDVNDVEIIK